jgi:PBP1b-binding outer membrane lipoprotein LpoB
MEVSVKTNALLLSKNNNLMKKIVALIAVLAVVLTSCSEYSCPTYSKKPVTEKKSTRV